MKKSKKEEKKNLILVHTNVEQTYDAYVNEGVTLSKLVASLAKDGKIPCAGADGEAVVECDCGHVTGDPNYVLQRGDILRVNAKTVDLSNTDKEFEKNLKLYKDGKLDPATDGGFSSRIEKLTPSLLERLQNAAACADEEEFDDDFDDEEDYDEIEDDSEEYEAACCHACGCESDVNEIDAAVAMLSDLLEKRGSSSGELVLRVEDGNPVHFRLTYK